MKEQKRKDKGGVKIHPLFLFVGMYYALTGELFVFFLSTLVAVQHELAHALAAAKLGYRLNKVVLMPFGALIDGDLEGLRWKDEIFVALAGPFCNLCTALLFLSLWWLYPSTYPFTDTAFYASLTIFAVNLVPAYPLDGGRVLKNALFSHFCKRVEPQAAKEKSAIICKKITLLFSCCFLALFILLCVKQQVNVSILFFALFLAVSAFTKEKDSCYCKIEFSQKKALARGMPVKRVAILSSAPLKKALALIVDGEYLVLSVYDDDEEYLGELTQNELAELFSTQDVYAPISLALQKRDRKILSTA